MSPHETFCRWLEGYLEAYSETAEDVNVKTVLQRLSVVLNPPPPTGPISRQLTTEDAMRELKRITEAKVQQTLGHSTLDKLRSY